jgi:fatty-acyl-CoA synthase
MTSSAYRHATLVEAIDALAHTTPEKQFSFEGSNAAFEMLPFPTLYARVSQVAQDLSVRGLLKGDRLGLIIIEPRDFILSFLAALKLGVIPVPLYPPTGLASLDAYSVRIAAILSTAQVGKVLTSNRISKLIWGVVHHCDCVSEVISFSTLSGEEPLATHTTIVPSDTAFLQFTSGSTDQPKGVVVTHAALVANCHAIMVDGIKVDDNDVGVTWLPLYHDMGLIGFVLAPIYAPVSVHFIPTMRFLRRPHVWLDAIHNLRGTLTSGPNFAYALAIRRATEAQLLKWDLSCIKMACCGAEPIHPDTLNAFASVLSKHCGLNINAMMPAYGLAEHTLAVTFSPLDQPLHVRTIDAVQFYDTGRACISNDDNAKRLTHVSCGAPFPGHELSIRNHLQQEVKAETEGEIWVRGPSSASRYYNTDAPDTFDAAGWVHTGDLGYLSDQQLYITGRLKDLIIVHGRNIHPQEIEWSVQAISGVRKGCVVAFSVQEQGSEVLILLVETRLDATLIPEIRTRVLRDHNLSAEHVILLAPQTIPKTSSGKLQRSAAKRAYQNGELNRTVVLPTWFTTVRHLLLASLAMLRHRLKIK